MSATADPLLETLVNDFGGNYVFALDLLEQYRQDRRSVDATWRAYFDKALGLPPEAESAPVTVIVNEAPKAEPRSPAAGAGLQTLVRQDTPMCRQSPTDAGASTSGDEGPVEIARR